MMATNEEDKKLVYIQLLTSNASLVEQFQKICHQKYSEILEHKRVKSMLIGMGIITIEDDFNSVNDNKPLLEALKQMLILNSAKSVEFSINPTHFVKSKKLPQIKYISDFDLLLTIVTKEGFKSFNDLRPENARLTAEELHHYWVNVRRTLKVEFTKMRNTMIYNFGLEGRFDMNEKDPPAPKPPKQLKTPEQV